MSEYKGVFLGYDEEDFRRYAKLHYKYRNTRLVFGAGINDANYMVQIEDHEWFAKTKQRVVVWRCPIYQHWMALIRRCYSKKQKLTQPYLDSTVCEGWLRFSNFRKWYHKERRKFDMPSCSLVVDKDLKVLGNNTYSPKTCLLLPCTVNSAISLKGQGLYPLGVSWKKRNQQYQAQILDNGNKRYLGLYPDVASAHKVWLREKSLYILKLKVPLGMEEYLRDSLVHLARLLWHCYEDGIQLSYNNISDTYANMTESITGGDLKRSRKYSEQLGKLYKLRKEFLDASDTDK